ncbi:MAG: DUF4783 domain-containing protein [Bacteroidales bacterium]|nr:DUF4783 domain-containing protein [Bacteroidales bacterium]
MKKLIVLPVLLVAFNLGIFAGGIPEDIVSAFRSGNAGALCSYINQTVELTIDNKEEIYSKSQAEVILKDFFSKHHPKSFNILHQANKTSSKYAIGDLETSSGNYRVTFLLKSVNSKVFIHQLRIENSND